MEDRRGKRVPGNKLKEKVRNLVREHIRQFPVEELFDPIEKYNKKYLDGHLNISKMYRMYKEQCTERNVSAEDIAKDWLYSYTLKHEFKYSFKIPGSYMQQQ